MSIKTKTKPMIQNTKYDDNNKSFFLLGKSSIAINKIVIGKKLRDNNLDRVAGIKKNEDRGQLLKIKYIESRRNIIQKIG